MLVNFKVNAAFSDVSLVGGKEEIIQLRDDCCSFESVCAQLDQMKPYVLYQFFGLTGNREPLYYRAFSDTAGTYYICRTPWNTRHVPIVAGDYGCEVFYKGSRESVRRFNMADALAVNINIDDVQILQYETNTPNWKWWWTELDMVMSCEYTELEKFAMGALEKIKAEEWCWAEEWSRPVWYVSDVLRGAERWAIGRCVEKGLIGQDTLKAMRDAKVPPKQQNHVRCAIEA